MINGLSFFLFKNLFSLKNRKNYLQRKLLNTAILVIVLIIPLVLSLIFMDGMIKGITDKYIALQDGHLQIYSKELKPIDSPLIASVESVITGFGIVYSSDATKEVKIKGVKETYFNKERLKQLEITGNFKKANSTAVASLMISNEMASFLGVELGNRVALIVIPDSSKSVVRPLLGEITALYCSGYYELDSNLIFMNYESAQRYFPLERDGYQEILARDSSDETLTKIISELEENEGNLFSWASWQQFNQSVYQNFITSRQVILVVFFLILVTAALYIGSIALEIVQDSIQRIALLKTFGLKNSALFNYYFSLIIMNVGASIGVGLAIGVKLANYLPFLLNYLAGKNYSFLRYYLLDFPIIINWPTLIQICVSLLLIASVTLYFSLRRIKKISVLELLQQD